MRRASWISIALVLIWPGSAWSVIQPLELKVKDDVLLSRAMEGGQSLTLPEFLVFTSKGTLIFHDKGFDSSFMDRLARAMRASAPLQGKLELRELLAEAVAMDGSPVPQRFEGKYEFVFVEYWAEWCAPCHQQKKAVTEYLSKNTGEKILWLYIRRDPTLLPNVSVQKSH